jgi:hypothetical protein
LAFSTCRFQEILQQGQQQRLDLDSLQESLGASLDAKNWAVFHGENDEKRHGSPW